MLSDSFVCCVWASSVSDFLPFLLASASGAVAIGGDDAGDNEEVAVAPEGRPRFLLA